MNEIFSIDILRLIIASNAVKKENILIKKRFSSIRFPIERYQIDDIVKNVALLLLSTNSLDLCEFHMVFGSQNLFSFQKEGVFHYVYLDNDKIYRHITGFCCRFQFCVSWICAITNRLNQDSVETSLVTQFSTLLSFLDGACVALFFSFFFLSINCISFFFEGKKKVSAIKLAVFALAQKICPQN